MTDRLLQYRLLERIGAGGMGVVSRSLDTRLQRELALKILPADKAGDAARRARFLREAQAASSLNHPNIVTIYEINSDQGIDFIAMELVHGRTLHQILREGRIDSARNRRRNFAPARPHGLETKNASVLIRRRSLKPFSAQERPKIPGAVNHSQDVHALRQGPVEDQHVFESGHPEYMESTAPDT